MPKGHNKDSRDNCKKNCRRQCRQRQNPKLHKKTIPLNLKGWNNNLKPCFSEAEGQTALDMPRQWQCPQP
jgi:hypothetical protein